VIRVAALLAVVAAVCACAAASGRADDEHLPMGYFTYRSHRASFSSVYTRLNIDLLREWTGDAALPVHAIGGLARDASPAQVRAFVRAAHADGVIGSSLYDFADTSARQWLELRGSNAVP
jgi:hypothetical protein